MKKLLVIFALLCVKELNAQSSVETFINEIYKEVVPENFEYYNLIDSSFAIEFNRLLMDTNERWQLWKENPDFPMEAFVQKSKASEKLNWKMYNLEKAKVYSYSEIPQYPLFTRVTRIVPYSISREQLDSLTKAEKKYFELIVKVKKTWGKRRVDKEVAKAWKNYSESVRNEDKYNFRFSTPIFHGDYAMIGLDKPGTGAIYLYKRVNGVWVKVLKFRRWIS